MKFKRNYAWSKKTVNKANLTSSILLSDTTIKDSDIIMSGEERLAVMKKLK